MEYIGIGCSGVEQGVMAWYSMALFGKGWNRLEWVKIHRVGIGCNGLEWIEIGYNDLKMIKLV